MKRFLLFFCGLPTLLLAQPNAPQPHSVHPDTLRIVSWNIFMLPPLVWRTGKRPRAEAIAEYFTNSNIDVLILQETFHHGARRRLWKGFKDTFPYEVGPANRKWWSPKAHSGIWILSRLPLTEIGSIQYEAKAGLDNKLARKGALMVQLRWKGFEFQLTGTHLNSGGPRQVRLAQVQQLSNELLAPNRQAGVPQITAGDFNMAMSDKALYTKLLEILDHADPQPYAGVPVTSDDPQNDMANANNPAVIDYAFFRRNGVSSLRVRNTVLRPATEEPWGGDKGRLEGQKRNLSDHNAVQCDLWLE